MPVHTVGQVPTINYQFPNGFPNVAVNVNCIFSSNYDIDTNQLVLSIHDYSNLEWDSVNNHFNNAIAYFIESDSYIGTDSSIIHAVIHYGIPAMFEPLSMRNFKVIPTRELKNNQSYDIMIKFLPMFSGIQWVRVDTIFQYALTTIDEMYSIETSSVLFNNSILKCTDTIYVKFNRKLNSATINMQDILTLHKVIGTSQIDSLYHTIVTEEVETECYLSEDSLKVCLNVNNLDGGGLYDIQVHLNLLTGNPNDNYSTRFQVGNLAVLSSGVKHNDEQTLLPVGLQTSFYGQEFYVTEGNEITITAPLFYDNFIFKHWQCETLPALNNSTELLLNIEVDCGMSGYHEIIAVYDNALIDTLTLADSLFLGGNILVEAYLDSLGFGQYTFVRKIDNVINIIPIADSGYAFNGWKYDTSSFVGLEIVGNSIRIPTNQNGISIMGDIFDPSGRNIDLGGGWGTLSSCTTIDFCFHFWALSGVIGSVVPNINSIVDVFINGVQYQLNTNESIKNGYVCITLPYPLEINELEFEFEFKDDCFYLERKRFRENSIIPEFVQENGRYVYNMNLAQASEYRNNQCKVFLDIRLRRKSFILKVDKALTGNDAFSFPATPFGIKVYNTTSQTYKTPRSGQGEPKTWEYSHITSGNKYWKIQETYDCDCGEELDIFPYLSDNSYELGYWSEPIPGDPDDYDLTYLPVIDPRVVDGTERNHVLLVSMHNNHHVQHRFGAKFRVIGFEFWLPKVIENNTIVAPVSQKFIPLDNIISSSGQTIALYETAAMNFAGLGTYEYLDPEIIPQTSQVYFRFNKQINPSTINNETFYCEDWRGTGTSGLRLDGKPLTKYVFNPEQMPRNSDFIYGDTRLLLQLSDNRNADNLCDIPHMSNFKVNLNFANIRSINNEPLSYKNFNKIGFLMSTENPALVAKSKKISILYKKWNPFFQYCFDSFYSHVWACVGFQNNITNLNQINSTSGVQYPYPNEYSEHLFMCDAWNILWNDTKMLCYVNRLNTDDLFAAGHHITLTYNNTEAYKKYSELTTEMLNTLLNTLVAEWELGQILVKFISGWQDISWWKFWAKKDKTWTVGDFTEPKTRFSLWGAGQLYKPKTILISTNKSILELEVTLTGQ